MAITDASVREKGVLSQRKGPLIVQMGLTECAGSGEVNSEEQCTWSGCSVLKREGNDGPMCTGKR